jgi:CHAT domain-containing protein
VQATSRAATLGLGPATLLAVGNPALDRTEYPDLHDLPHADVEARAVADRYPGSHVVLRGSEATRDAVLRAFTAASVIHFAGHAVTTPWVTDASFLALSGPRPSRLTASEVRALDLRRSRLVVLAACETAAGSQSTLDSPLSLSRAFLAAGAANVLGSLWVASDRASRALFEAFHDAYVETGDAAESLRRAQAALASSADPTLAAPRQWAGFVVMGGSAIRNADQQIAGDTDKGDEG